MNQTADTPPPDAVVLPRISVRGEAVLAVEPEIARLTVDVRAEDKDRRRALDRLTERNHECLRLIEEYGEAIEQVETSGLSISPVAREKRRDERVQRYQGTVHTTVTVADFAPLGEIVTRLADLELTTVRGPWWALRRDSDVYRRAAQQAVREARTRAMDYADALGCRLTGLVELADEGLSTDGGVRAESYGTFMAADALATGTAAHLDLEPQTQIVRARVEARFTATAPAF